MSELSIEDLKNELQNKGIRPSYQRIKVLECLHQEGAHPTVDEIYHILSPQIPSLSKATIYNSLHSFVDAGLVHILNIDDNEMRYDAILKEHGHFKCQRCNSIFNFQIDMDNVSIDGLRGFKIAEKNVTFNGLCPDCLSQIERKES